MTKEDIKPIPKYIIQKIKKFEGKWVDAPNTRYYSYFTKIKDELVQITVACKWYHRQWFCKQVVVHGIHSEKCFVRDIEYFYISGYTVSWFWQGISPTEKRYEDGEWYLADDKYYHLYAMVVNKNFALKMDAYKYSAIDKYPYNDVLKYLKIYEKYPHVEYFVKLGLSHLALSKMLLKKTEKDKKFRRWLIQYARILRNEYGDQPYYSVKVILECYKENMTLCEGQEVELDKKILMQNHTYHYRVRKLIKRNEAGKFLEYLRRQDISVSLYADYLEACESLGLDMTLPEHRYPRNFKYWHDVRIDQYHTAEAIKDAEKRRELYEKFADIAKKYTPLQRNKENDFIVIIAKTPQDLIREGSMLHHCVGRMNYDQRIAREESLIFFVRNANAPNTPFVTMEYSIDRKKILQCYGENNHTPDDNVMEFVNKKWLPYANRKIKKLAA